MRIEEIEKMISYQKRTIQNAKRISTEFQSGYMAALSALTASIEAAKHDEQSEPYLQQIV